MKFVLQTLSIISGLLYLHFDFHEHSFYSAVPNVTLACAFLVSLWGILLLYKATKKQNA